MSHVTIDLNRISSNNNDSIFIGKTVSLCAVSAVNKKQFSSQTYSLARCAAGSSKALLSFLLYSNINNDTFTDSAQNDQVCKVCQMSHIQ